MVFIDMALSGIPIPRTETFVEEVIRNGRRSCTRVEMKPTLIEDDVYVKQPPSKKSRAAYAPGAPASTSACDVTAIVPLEDDESVELREGLRSQKPPLTPTQKGRLESKKSHYPCGAP